MQAKRQPERPPQLPTLSQTVHRMLCCAGQQRQRPTEQQRLEEMRPPNGSGGGGASPPPPSPSPPEEGLSFPIVGRREDVDAVRELLTRKISVLCKDGRRVVGDLVCLDKQGNLVLYNAHEYYQGKGEAAEEEEEGQRGFGSGQQTMGGTQTILIPYEQQTKEIVLLDVPS